MSRFICCFALLFATLGIVATAFANAPRVFVDVDEAAIVAQGQRDVRPLAYRTVALDEVALTLVLDQAPVAGNAQAGLERVVLELPYPDGTFQRFAVEEAPIMAPELAAKFPGLRTYRGQGIDDPRATVRFDLTPQGFHAMVLSHAGSVLIDPYQRGDRDHYVVYNKADYTRAEPTGFTCGVASEPRNLVPASTTGELQKLGGLPSNGGTLRTYRLAVAATGEYTAFHSAGAPTVAEGMAAIVIAMNRVNGIYERDVSLTMELVANNDLIVYTDGTTDPYTNNNGFTMLGQNQTNIDNVIGSANYDIGHVFSTGGGGVASLRVPCSSGKARGVTGLGSPTGDIFWVDYVAHEMGHQWGGNHTFNGSVGACSGGNRNPSTAYEPGSGSTIQAYAGICGAQNIQGNSDDHFHTISLQEIVNYSVQGNGNSCPTQASTGNGVPTVDAGPSYTIPLNTPFELCASGTDPNSDPLTFNWEQFNLGPAGAPGTPVGDAPIFRSWPSTVTPCRTFPRLADILTGSSTIGELLPSYARTLTFRVTARDNQAGGGAFDTDQVDVVVSDQGDSFQVTAPESAVVWNTPTADVTWDVAGTDLSPISCSQVDILVSEDGGQTFPHMVATATSNDGTETITVPQASTTQARVKVQCSDNIFFDISGVDFTIEMTTMIFADSFDSGNANNWTTVVP